MAENQNNPVDNSNIIQNLQALQDPNYAALRRAVADGVAEATARNRTNPANTSQSIFQDRRRDMEIEKNSKAKAASEYRRSGNFIEDFETGITDAMLDAIAGGDFKKGMSSALSEFTKQFGFELKDLPHQLGKHFGQQLMDSQLGQQFKNQASKLGDRFLTALFNPKDSDQKAASGALKKVFQSLLNGATQNGSQAASSAAGNAASQAAQNAASNAAAQNAGNVAQGGAIGGSELAGLAKAAQGLIPVAALVAVFIIAMKPMIEGVADFVKAWISAFNREENSRSERLKNARKRMEADMEYLAKEPFEILTNAAKKWEETWDANLAKVSLTQGYTKENTYALYSSIAERLKNDKTWSGDASLSSVIAATDVINNLSSVLDAGLSGAVAEEFAYQATKLNAAIPTENFIGYASTYAQLAADAISRGQSEEEALAYANKELTLFASNLLYSSRTLSGGFSTGLKNAESLFKDAVDIAQTAKTSNVSQISGTLTAVAGVIGAVAPDLAQGLVQNIVSAATGGNSDSLVALRSLAGVNASNTEFLRQFANDPQGVFVSLFRNLAELQSMSPDNYMEVAEGLSSIFGVDMKALARVDFNQLANSIANMDVSYESISENIALLKEGQATTSTEQLKMQEINNLIAEESLAYAIDSEAGRVIQQHMWEEQMNNALMENEYAVNLQGGAMTALEGIRHTIANILGFLNPIGYVANGIERLVAVQDERDYNAAQIAQVLQLGAIGGNQKVLDNLLNVSGVDMKLTKSLVEMMGGTGYTAADRSVVGRVGDVIGGILSYNPLLWGIQGLTYKTSANGIGIMSADSWNENLDAIGGYQALNGIFGIEATSPYQAYATSSGINKATSRYKGFSVGKSALAAASSYTTLPDVVRNVAESATESAMQQVAAQWNAFIESAESASEDMSFEAWLKTAKDFGLDLSDLSDVGLSEEDLRGYYEALQSGQAGAVEQDRKKDQDKFRDEGREFYKVSTESFGSITSTLTAISNKIAAEGEEFTVVGALSAIYTDIHTTFVSDSSDFQKCLADWIRYIAEAKSYQSSISNASAWSELKQAEGEAQQETLLALANAMNVFSADELKKLDPQLQANALLGQIIIILQTMLQQNSTVAGGLSLPDTMAALGFGMTYKNGT